MDARRKELAEFLQVLRERSQPQDFGFPPGTRRRTKGLRREEMAQLVGISPTWYTWVEQGREVNVSAEVLERLASRLQLTRSERAYLFEMAGRRDVHAATQEADTAPSALSGLLATIAVPAYIMGRYWDMLAWNAQAAELFTGWLDCVSADAAEKPNLLRFVFLMPQTRQFLADWDVRARRITAEFRADCRARLDEPAMARMVAELSQASSDFAQFWKQHDVLERHGGERRFNHPRLGSICFEQTTLRPVEQEHLKLVLLNPLKTCQS